YWVAFYSGDSKNDAAGPTGCTAEPVVVAKNSPALSTTQLPAAGAIGATYKDTAHLRSEEWRVEKESFNLCSNYDCKGLLHSETATVAGNGDYTTGTGFVHNDAGT